MSFTVKVRAANGAETLYSCETVTVIGGPGCNPVYSAGEQQAGAQRDMYEEGIYLDREEHPQGPGEPPLITAPHIIQFGGDETSDRAARKGGKVWVMNEQGATVATYDL
jgi:hypothetical protein